MSTTINPPPPLSRVEERTPPQLRLDVDPDGIAVVVVDVPAATVNVLSPILVDELEQILGQLETDDRIRAVVIRSAKPGSFLAGLDVGEVLRIRSQAVATSLSRRLQHVFARLEALHQERGKPVVAAIDGAACGGGLDLALCCCQRIVSDSKETVLGWPEVELGLIPSAGATQRLPPLIGIAKALELILTGRDLLPGEAETLGLVDEVVPAAILLEVARRRAEEAVDAELPSSSSGLERLKELAQEVTDPEFLQQLALEENPVGQRILFKKAREQVLAKTRGNYPAPEHALEVVRIGVQESFELGYAAEAERFGLVVVSPEARAMMSLHLAREEANVETGAEDPAVEPRIVQKLCVLGGDALGGGVAAIGVARAGATVRIKEEDDAGVLRVLRHVRRKLDADVEHQRYTAAEAERLMHRVTGTIDMSGFELADLVIEAVADELDAKREALLKVEAHASDDTIFASTTSSIPIAQIALASSHPETVVGMHYFTPVDEKPLLEVAVTRETEDWVIATCVELGRRQGKTVIVVQDGTGFYVLRVLVPFLNEALRLLVEGAAVDAIDGAMSAWGFPVGPLALADDIGIGFVAKVAGAVEQELGDRLRSPGALTVLLDDNRGGREAGRGFYLYEDGNAGEVDESVYSLLGQSTERQEVPTEEIQLRLVLQLVNEACRCLEEGVLRSARDGDIGAVLGLGFPPYTGGPFSWADRVGTAEIVRRLERFAQQHGKRFEPAEILRVCAREGRRLR